MPRKTKTGNTPLTGQTLLAKVEELKDYTREEKAKICGYVTIEDDGFERINFMAFLNALIDAEGVNLDRVSSDQRRPSERQPSYKTSVRTTGNLCIGAAYTKQMKLEPGDEFQVSLGRKHIHLKLVTEKN